MEKGRYLIPMQHACDQALSALDLSKVATPESESNRVKEFKREAHQLVRFESRTTGGWSWVACTANRCENTKEIKRDDPNDQVQSGPEMQSVSVLQQPTYIKI